MSEESNREILGDDLMNRWMEVCKKRDEEIANGTYEPCCDENNECCCNTYSPYMATLEDVKKFNERMDRISGLIKIESDKQSWQRKLRNRYLGYKYTFQDWIYKLKN